MSMLDGLLGGAVGAGVMTAVNHVLEQHGGLQGVIGEFQKKGFGPTVQSWIGTGQNEPISADDVHHVFGADTIQQIAQKVGMSPSELAAKLSQVLPAAIDKLTPHGEVPKSA